MSLLIRTIISAVIAGLVCAGFMPSGLAAERTSFRFAWHPYVGWSPWAYAVESKVLDHWAAAAGVTITAVRVDGYSELVAECASGTFDACTLDSVAALTVTEGDHPDWTAVLVGGFSDGNDGIVAAQGMALADLADAEVGLAAPPVSHYLLARALEMAGGGRAAPRIIDLDGAAAVALAEGTVNAVAARNPQLAAARTVPETTLLFDSSVIPGEISDFVVARNDAIVDNPALARALVGAWYEVAATVARGDAESMEARALMADAAGIDLASLHDQLETAWMFVQPSEAAAFTATGNFAEAMAQVREFLIASGRIGGGGDAPDPAVRLPGGQTIGHPEGGGLTIDDRWMALAAEGRL